MSRNCKRDELERLANEAQYVVRATHLDLDAFIALPADERAIRWSQWDTTTKAQAVTLMLIRKYGDWDDELVAAYIAHYDEKWALAPSEVAVANALVELEAEHRQFERTARAAGDRDEARYWARAANAYRSARIAYVTEGVRPASLGNRSYVLPSRSNGPSHLLRFDGDWQCSCAAGDSMHWAKALLVGLEKGVEQLDRDDDPTEIEPAPDYTARELGARLARARLVVLTAA